MAIRIDGLTDEEGEVMNTLIKAWNLFTKLSKEQQEANEFARGINKCQDILGLRVLRRDYPIGWVNKGREVD